MESKYKVKLAMNGKLVSGIPESEDTIKAWLSAHKIQDDEQLAEKIAAGIITQDDLDEELKELTRTFMQVDGVPVIEARCVHAMLKQTAEVMGLYGIIDGFRELMREGSEVFPRMIPIGKLEDVKIATKVIHAKVQGKTVSGFSRARYIEKAVLEFEVHSINRYDVAEKYGKAKPTADGTQKAQPKKKALLTLELLKDILAHAGKYIGLGSDRSQGEGKFEVVSVEKID